MIISHKHKFIFIKTRKTAGTSIEIMLSKICGNGDIITSINKEDESIRKMNNGKGPQNYYIPFKFYQYIDWIRLFFKFKRKKFSNHNTALEVKNNIDSKIWDSYFKFCFDRNPYDKVISFYYWRGGADIFASIDEYIKSGDIGRLKGYDSYAINGLVAVDEIYKFENIKQGIDDISKILNLDEPLLLPSKKAKSSTRKDKRHYSEILSDDARNLISIMFAREIRMLKYQY